jgi:hypothetical protein
MSGQHAPPVPASGRREETTVGVGGGPASEITTVPASSGGATLDQEPHGGFDDVFVGQDVLTTTPAISPSRSLAQTFLLGRAMRPS